MTNGKLLIKYLVLLIIGGIAVWQIMTGNTSFGTGLLAGILIAGVLLGINSRQIIQNTEKGMDPYDERVWAVAGKASYAALKIFAVIIALIVLLGSIWGPQLMVNPYNLLGICLAGLMLMYVCFYYYYNSKM
ncbi:MAG TPA: DUF2178 domain-containing protein [Syntrophomonadaceae bacterium]|jgi:uncharacterized membrane protein|nr:DUF2178 domain-containing protein [Syntrophomonadaceae bacterium]